MENKKTQDLMSRKSTLKSKLMAAVSMLLVSAIMVSVTTYAWFILSTAPEVKGMSTTVGSNGALEMALLNNDTGANLDLIKSSVGDSSAVKSVVESNVTWGNLVDLNDASYGLSGITMYPARLNWATGGTKNTLESRNKLLSYAQYGTDGRIADLIAADSGTNTDSGFVSDANSYGVRAIGTAKDQDPVAAALQGAQSAYKNNQKFARDAVLTALNGAVQTMGDIAYKHATAKTDEYYTAAQVKDISDALAGLETATGYIETALKYAVIANAANGKSGTVKSIDDVQLSESEATVGTYYKTLTELRTAITTAKGKIPGNPANAAKGYTWDEIKGAYMSLMDIESMTLGEGENAKTTDEVRNMSEEQKTNWGIALVQSGLKITAKAGLFSDAVDFVDEVTSTESAKVQKIDCTIYVTKTSKVSKAHLVTLGEDVAAYKYDGNGENQATITDKYGYAVDLAFRSNAPGKLKLSDAAVRVEGDASNTTMGGGCYFTASATSDKNALAALRIAFVNDRQEVLAVGKLEIKDDNTTNKYPVHLYKFSVKDEVLEVTNNAVENDVILDLQANEAVALTAVVFMDGDATSFAQGEASGSLNLQFCTSANLQAMNYTNYATAGLTFEGEVTQATVGQTGIVRPTTIKVGNTTLTDAEMNKVTWKSSKEDVATVDKTTGVVAAGSTAGETVITATYTDNSGTHTGSYTLTVKAS